MAAGGVAFAARVPGKTRCGDLHPTRPLLATIDESLRVMVFDYVSKTVQANLLLSELEDNVRERIALHALLQRDPAFTGDKTEEAVPPREKLGNVRGIRFLDQHVLLWKRYLETMCGSTEVTTSASALPDSSGRFALAGSRAVKYPRLLIIALEYRIILMDYVSLSYSDIKQAQFGSGRVAAIELLAGQTRLAIGFADGVVRIWNLISQAVEEQLESKKHSAVVKMIAYAPAGGQASNATGLIVGHADGSVILFDIASRSVTNTFSKVHDVLHDVALDPASRDIVSVGADRFIVATDIANASERARVRGNVVKHAFTSVVCLPHPGVPDGTVLVSAKDSRIWRVVCADSADTAVVLFLDLAQHATWLEKKQKIKIYMLLLHPVDHTLLACSTNHGVVVVRLPLHASPRVARVPPRIPVAAAPAATDPQQQQHPALAYLLSHGVLNRIATSPGQRGRTAVSASRILRLDAALSAGVVSVSVSASGRAVALVSAAAARYHVYSTAGSSCSRVDAGAGTCLVWASHTSDRYAVLDSGSGGDGLGTDGKLKHSVSGSVADARSHSPRSSTDAKNTGSKTLTRAQSVGKDVSSLSRASGAVAAAASAADDAASFRDVRIRHVNSNGSTALPREDASIATASPVVGLHGGALLGLVLASHHDDAPLTLQFFDWASLLPVGPCFPAPGLVSWDPSHRYVALAYPDELILLSMQPRVQMLARLPVAAADMTWYHGTLFLVTPDAVLACFVHAEDTRCHTLATTEPDLAPLAAFAALRSSRGAVAARLEASIVPVQLRPAGVLSLLGVAGDDVILADALACVHAISIAHPLIKAMILVTADRLSDALEWASVIHPQLHAEFAHFLAVRGHGSYAVDLLGLAAWSKVALCQSQRLFERGLHVLLRLASDLHVSTQQQHEQQHQHANDPGAAAVLMTSHATREKRRIIKAMHDLAAAAEASDNDSMAIRILEHASQLDASAYHRLILLQARCGNRSELRRIYDQLMLTEGYHDAALAASLLPDRDLLRAALLRDAQYALGIAASAVDGDASVDALLRQWNAQLRVQDGPRAMQVLSLQQ